MRRSQDPPPGRQGFTLIEVLLVAAIIALLVSITSLGALKVMAKADEVRNRKDITDLQLAVRNFQTQFKVPYIPSRIKLAPVLNAANYPAMSTPNTLDADSVQFLTRVFPNIVRPAPGDPGYPPAGGNWYTGIDWSGAGLALFTSPVILEGDQCLVFFLGGIPGGGTCRGYSANSQNPATLGGDRLKPFLDFDPTRLAVLPPNALSLPGRSPVHFSYLDAYGTPFAYFSAYKVRNGYLPYGGTDCPTLAGAYGLLAPYQDTLTTFLNPDSFQIISAGKNKLFGPGSAANLWTASAANVANPPGSNGADDMSNFHDLLLGKPK
jgi:prepilin-type N-terminal cleavage/methylation domain-containing protein